ncbi:MAG: glycosyltransferase [Alphaproteobacteria bacterium]|nr:glycosyltransferase [Alphaproteobacteria bacterium]
MSAFAVVVPALVRTPEHAENLRRCLEALAQCDPAPAEAVVVDDGSPEPIDLAPWGLAGAFEVIRQPNAGPASARNAGARATTAPVLVFVDADICVPPDTFARLAAALEAHPDAAAVWGTVTAAHPHPGPVSRYKNLTHRHFTLRQGDRHGLVETPHLTTMLAAVRREAFEAVGGFDTRLTTVSVEDVELGRALVDAGGRVLLDPGLEAEHRHRFTLGSAVRNDAHKLRRLVSATLRRRAAGGTSVAGDRPADARMRRYVLTIPLGLGATGFALTGRWGRAALCLGALAVAERDLLAFLADAGGRRFALACLPLMALERTTATAAIALGVVDFVRDSAEEP